MESTVTRWRCDVCGEWVKPEDGYVVWDYKDHQRTGFQIIHRGQCDDNKAPASNALVDFLGPDGLTYSLSLMSDGPIRQGQRDEPEDRRKIADQEEFADFLRRLYVPNYEEARNKFGLPIVRDEWSDASESRPYRQDALKRIAKAED